MKFVLVTGPAITIECAVCQAHIVGGTEPYPSASTGESVQPAEVYQEDPTRSVNQFFSDTQGKEIEAEHL
jgi:hypothetical protein